MRITYCNLGLYSSWTVLRFLKEQKNDGIRLMLTILELKSPENWFLQADDAHL